MNIYQLQADILAYLGITIYERLEHGSGGAPMKTVHIWCEREYLEKMFEWTANTHHGRMVVISEAVTPPF